MKKFKVVCCVCGKNIRGEKDAPGISHTYPDCGCDEIRDNECPTLRGAGRRGGPVPGY